MSEEQQVIVERASFGIDLTTAREKWRAFCQNNPAAPILSVYSILVTWGCYRLGLEFDNKSLKVFGFGVTEVSDKKHKLQEFQAAQEHRVSDSLEGVSELAMALWGLEGFVEDAVINWESIKDSEKAFELDITMKSDGLWRQFFGQLGRFFIGKKSPQLELYSSLESWVERGEGRQKLERGLVAGLRFCSVPFKPFFMPQAELSLKTGNLSFQQQFIEYLTENTRPLDVSQDTASKKQAWRVSGGFKEGELDPRYWPFTKIAIWEVPDRGVTFLNFSGIAIEDRPWFVDYACYLELSHVQLELGGLRPVEGEAYYQYQQAAQAFLALKLCQQNNLVPEFISLIQEGIIACLKWWKGDIKSLPEPLLTVEVFEAIGNKFVSMKQIDESVQQRGSLWSYLRSQPWDDEFSSVAPLFLYQHLGSKIEELAQVCGWKLEQKDNYLLELRVDYRRGVEWQKLKPFKGQKSNFLYGVDLGGLGYLGIPEDTFRYESQVEILWDGLIWTKHSLDGLVPLGIRGWLELNPSRKQEAPPVDYTESDIWRDYLKLQLDSLRVIFLKAWDDLMDYSHVRSLLIDLIDLMIKEKGKHPLDTLLDQWTFAKGDGSRMTVRSTLEEEELEVVNGLGLEVLDLGQPSVIAVPRDFLEFYERQGIVVQDLSWEVTESKRLQQNLNRWQKDTPTQDIASWGLGKLIQTESLESGRVCFFKAREVGYPGTLEFWQSGRLIHREHREELKHGFLCRMETVDLKPSGFESRAELDGHFTSAMNSFLRLCQREDLREFFISQEGVQEKLKGVVTEGRVGSLNWKVYDWMPAVPEGLSGLVPVLPATLAFETEATTLTWSDVTPHLDSLLEQLWSQILLEDNPLLALNFAYNVMESPLVDLFVWSTKFEELKVSILGSQPDLKSWLAGCRYLEAIYWARNVLDEEVPPGWVVYHGSLESSHLSLPWPIEEVTESLQWWQNNRPQEDRVTWDYADAYDISEITLELPQKRGLPLQLEVDAPPFAAFGWWNSCLTNKQGAPLVNALFREHVARLVDEVEADFKRNISENRYDPYYCLSLLDVWFRKRKESSPRLLEELLDLPLLQEIEQGSRHLSLQASRKQGVVLMVHRATFAEEKEIARWAPYLKECVGNQAIILVEELEERVVQSYLDARDLSPLVGDLLGEWRYLEADSPQSTKSWVWKSDSITVDFYRNSVSDFSFEVAGRVLLSRPCPPYLLFTIRAHALLKRDSLSSQWLVSAEQEQGLEKAFLQYWSYLIERPEALDLREQIFVFGYIGEQGPLLPKALVTACIKKRFIMISSPAQKVSFQDIVQRLWSVEDGIDMPLEECFQAGVEVSTFRRFLHQALEMLSLHYELGPPELQDQLKQGVAFLQRPLWNRAVTLDRSAIKQRLLELIRWVGKALEPSLSWEQVRLNIEVNESLHWTSVTRCALGEKNLAWKILQRDSLTNWDLQYTLVRVLSVHPVLRYRQEDIITLLVAGRMSHV